MRSNTLFKDELHFFLFNVNVRELDVNFMNYFYTNPH